MKMGMKKELSSTYEQALAKIPEALKSEGFGILTEIDVQDTLKKKIGVEFRRYKILGACNPTLAHRTLQVELGAGVMLPCNVIVYEADDGKAVVHAVDPLQTVAASVPELADVAHAVREKLERVLGRLE